MNRFDTLIYKHNMSKVLSTEESNDDNLLPFVHYFYKGIVEHDAVKAITDNTRVQMLSKSSRGKILKSIELAKEFYASTDEQDEDESDTEYASRLRNAVNTEAFKKKIQDVAEDSDEANEIVGLLAGNGDSLKPESQFDQDELALRRQISKSPGLRKILNLVGRFRSFMNKVKRTKKVYNPAVKSDIETGNDIFSATMMETLKFAIPEYETLIKLKLATKSMLQYSHYSNENVAKGDVVIMIDSSSSMLDKVHFFGEDYQMIDVVKAMALATMLEMKSQNRKCQVYSFDCVIHDLTKYDSDVANFRSVLNLYAHGGTSINNALFQAFTSSHVKDKACDVILLTDATDYVTPETLTPLKGDARLITVFVANQFAQAAYDISALKGMSDVWADTSHGDQMFDDALSSIT